MNSLTRYILKRILIAFFIIVLAGVFAFCVIRFVPGDPVRAMIGSDADEAAVEAARRSLNLDKPLFTQMQLWFGNILNGNLGRSLVLNDSINRIFAARIPTTLSLSIPAFTIAIVFGIFFGTICATQISK